MSVALGRLGRRVTQNPLQSPKAPVRQHEVTSHCMPETVKAQLWDSCLFNQPWKKVARQFSVSEPSPSGCDKNRFYMWTLPYRLFQRIYQNRTATEFNASIQVVLRRGIGHLFLVPLPVDVNLTPIEINIGFRKTDYLSEP